MHMQLTCLSKSRIIKQARLIQEALLAEFNNVDKEKQCENWEELKTTNNINHVVYSRFLNMCDAWLKSHLKAGTKKIDFPTETRNYIEWTINIRKEKSKESMNLPWLFYVVNLELEGRSYLQRHFENPKPIG